MDMKDRKCFIYFSSLLLFGPSSHVLKEPSLLLSMYVCKEMVTSLLGGGMDKGLRGLRHA